MPDSVIRFSIAALLCAALVTGLLGVPSSAEEAVPSHCGVDEAALFRIAGAMYDVDPGLLRAIAAVESDGRAAAVSPAGAAGVMQLMPATARQFGVSEAFDPVDSVLGAARFLNHLRNRQRMVSAFNLPALVAAYNAGEGAVERYHGVPPYPETEQYVRRVLWHYILDEASRSPRDGAITKTVVMPSANDGDTALLNQLARLRRERRRARRDVLIVGTSRRGE